MVGRLLPSEQPLELMYFYMAPPDGLEPPHVGIKIRCLTNLAKRVQNYFKFLMNRLEYNRLDGLCQLYCCIGTTKKPQNFRCEVCEL